MDSLETIYVGILENQGYWVKRNFKVKLSKEDKRELGTPTMPDFEIDIIAYKPEDQSLLIVECKSFLDSAGVDADCLDPDHKYSTRFKIFTREKLRHLILERLEEQLHRSGLAARNPKVTLRLVAGKIKKGSETKLRQHFDNNGWQVEGPVEIKALLVEIAKNSYVNDPVVMTAKILLR